MADGFDTYIASLKLAQGPQSYSEGAHVAATFQSINQAAQARAFQETMDIISGQDKRNAALAQQRLEQQKIDNQFSESQDRMDLQSQHYAAMAQGKAPQALAVDPNDPFANGGGQSQTGGYAGQPAPADDGMLPAGVPGTAAYADQQAAASPAPAGTNTNDYASYAPGAAPSPVQSSPLDGPLVTGGQSAPAPNAPDAPGNQPTPRGQPLTQPGVGEVADGGGLLPPVNGTPPATAAPTPGSPATMGATHPEIPQAKMGGDGKWWIGSNSKFSDIKGPDGSDSTQRIWEARNPKTGQFGISHVETFKGKPAVSNTTPWTEDESGRKFVDGVEVEPTNGRTLANGTKIWDYKAAAKQPFIPDPTDPTKGALKGAGGQEIPVTVEGINQGSDGKLSYRFKTAKGGADISAPITGDALADLKTQQDMVTKAGFSVKEWALDKTGKFIPKPGIALATDPKASDNSIGSLQKNMGPIAKKEADSQFLAMTTPSVDEKAKWIAAHGGDIKDPKAWSDAYHAISASAADKLAGILNAHNYGRPGFRPVTPDKLIQYRSGSAMDEIPPAVLQASSAPDAQAPSAVTPTAPQSPPASTGKPAWMSKLGIGSPTPIATQ